MTGFSHTYARLDEAQRAAVDHEHGPVVVCSVAGSGKCLGVGTPVLMYDGRTKRVEDVCRGDLLLGPDSKPRKVLSTSCGFGPLYKIVPKKGDPWVCNDVHVMTLAGTNRHRGETIDIPLDQFLDRPRTGPLDRDWKLVRTGVEFQSRGPASPNPYMVGLWIGNGHVADAIITQRDPEVITYCQAFAPKLGLECRVKDDPRNNTKTISIRVPGRGHRGTPNVFRNYVLSHCVQEGEKVLPTSLQVASTLERLELLAGLLDSDGYYGNGYYEITTKYAGLADQILFVARSLGFAAYKTTKRATIKQTGFVGFYWRIQISGDLDRIPCRVARKRARSRRQVKRVGVIGWRVETLPPGPFCGFELDEDGRFLLGDFTVTHNTTVITAKIWSLVVRSKVAPERVCACAFTRESAIEINTRLTAYGLPSTLRVGTLHAIALDILRTADRAAGGGAEVDDRSAVRNMLKSVLSRELRDEDLKIEVLERLIGLAKARGLAAVGPDAGASFDALRDLAKTIVKPAFKLDAYLDAFQRGETARLRANLITFDDMVPNACAALRRDDALRKMWQDRYDHVLVDEAQDLSSTQFNLARLLAERTGNLTFAGDSSQAIYRWRGAAPEEFLAAVNTSTVYRAVTNYRCAPAICAAASRVVAGRPWNVTGALVPARTDDPPRVLEALEFDHTEDEAAAVAREIIDAHADGVPWSGFAVLYRVTSLAHAVETALLRASIPYRVLSGTGFYDRKESKDLLAYLRVGAVRDPDGEWTKRAMNRPFRYLGKMLIAEVEAAAKRMHIPMLDALAKHRPAQARQGRTIKEFVSLVVDVNAAIVRGVRPDVVLEDILARTNYLEWLSADEGSESIGMEAARTTNVHELVRIAREFATVPALLDYADQMSLAAGRARQRRRRVDDVVSLTTIHAAKGLEFDNVVLVGASDSVMPMRGNPDQDEERRLFYVALTRARNHVLITRSTMVPTPRGIMRTEPSPLVKDAGIQWGPGLNQSALAETRAGRVFRSLVETPAPAEPAVTP